MSLSALLTAVRNQVRNQLKLEKLECGCQLDGHPPPSFGGRYVAVHPTGWGPGDSQIDHGLDEVYRVTCTITMRTPVVPKDRMMDELFLKALSGMETLAREIIAHVHQNYTVMNEANSLIAGDDKLIQPLFWDGCDVPPRPETGAWVWSDSAKDIGHLAALVLPVRFREARRVQDYENME
ncbi:MAG TPA: hypothetical protein VMY37_04550 [Thermoguttaceae bacterium]|nr:hypothetical protein [Thermoguttaceae bacterium]